MNIPLSSQRLVFDSRERGSVLLLASSMHTLLPLTVLKNMRNGASREGKGKESQYVFNRFRSQGEEESGDASDRSPKHAVTYIARRISCGIVCPDDAPEGTDANCSR